MLIRIGNDTLVRVPLASLVGLAIFLSTFVAIAKDAPPDPVPRSPWRGISGLRRLPRNGSGAGRFLHDGVPFVGIASE